MLGQQGGGGARAFFKGQWLKCPAQFSTSITYNKTYYLLHNTLRIFATCHITLERANKGKIEW